MSKQQEGLLLGHTEQGGVAGILAVKIFTEYRHSKGYLRSTFWI